MAFYLFLLVSTNLHQIRSTLRLQRRNLSPVHQSRASYLAKTLIVRAQMLKHRGKIAFYYASDGELDPSIIFKFALGLGKECYLPVIDRKSKVLFFRRYQPGTLLLKNRYGIPEPAPSSKHIAAEELDLILMPLVGFDKKGNRLGMGGGYYDQTLQPALTQRKKKPILVGLAHSCQEVLKLSPRPWDVALDMVVTEREIIKTGKIAVRLPAAAQRSKLRTKGSDEH